MRYSKSISRAEDTCCRGNYLQITIEKVLVNVPVEATSVIESQSINEPVTLIRVLYFNLWRHRVQVFGCGEAKMIDTQGLQYSQLDKGHCEEKVTVKLPKSRRVPVILKDPERIVEPNAGTRGWLWFQKLEKGVLPQRLVFAFDIFENDHTSGSVHDTEIIDFTFLQQDLTMIPQLLELNID